jgi:uncharacterized protein
MTPADFSGTWQYASQRLEEGLSPLLTYHCVAHTRDDVLPAAKRLAVLENVAGEELNLLLTAAWYHDIGFVENQAANHETIGVRIVAEVLPRYGLSPGQIRAISGMIMVTRLPQAPVTHLEQILADADLDLLGRDDFWFLNQALRAETAALGRPTTDEAWYSGQLAFLQAHRYFTASARALREAGKQRNIEVMIKLLEKQR